MSHSSICVVIYLLDIKAWLSTSCGDAWDEFSAEAGLVASWGTSGPLVTEVGFAAFGRFNRESLRQETTSEGL